MTNFTPTDEQVAALDAFATGEDMVLEAGAGTGKTSTLKLMADSTDRRGVYLAYNRAIADDAKGDFPRTVKVGTAHSFAYRAIVNSPDYSWMRGRLNGGRVPSKVAVQILGIPYMGF